MLFIRLSTNNWWEYDKEKNIVYNYNGGYHEVSTGAVEKSETIECSGWHELYCLKRYCPIETTVRSCHIWISPDGRYYEAPSHDIAAEDICKIIYGTEPMYPGDELEKRGWIRATIGAMWEYRLDEWKDKQLTQRQMDALYAWCKQHGKTYPYD